MSRNTRQLAEKKGNFAQLERSQYGISHFRVFQLTLKNVYDRKYNHNQILEILEYGIFHGIFLEY